MNKKIKLLLTILAYFLISTNCFAEPHLTSTKWNDCLNLEAPLLKDNHYYIHVRALFFPLNSSFKWNSEAQTVTVLYKTHEIKFTLNSPYATYDDKKFDMKCTPFIENNLFYIPVHILPELFPDILSYKQEDTILKLYSNNQTIEMAVSNPLKKIKPIKDIDFIRYTTLSLDKVIEIKDKTQIQSIMNDYQNNSYTRIDYAEPKTMGYSYGLELYSKGQKILKIWVIDNTLISLDQDTCYYKLQTPLNYSF